MQAVQREVEFTFGFVPRTCWIVHVLELLGKKLRVAPNRIDPNVRKHPCPSEKQAAIIEALRKLEQQDVWPRRISL
jgi:hypothetical protein